MSEHILLMQIQLIAIILCFGFGVFYLTVRFFDPKKSSLIRLIDKGVELQKSTTLKKGTHNERCI
jgi:hypothetical protein